MFDLIRDSLRDFRDSYKVYFSFEFLYLFLSSFIFVPIISYTFNRMLTVNGSGTLLNAEVYKIGLSYTGIIGMCLISLIAVIILFIEYGVLITIAQKKFFNKTIYISEALLTTIKKLPRLLGLGIIFFMIIILLVLPFIDSPMLPALLDFNIPIFLASQLDSSLVLLMIYGLIFIVITYLLIRSIFTLHFIFIDGLSIWRGLKRSFKLTKGRTLHIIFLLLGINVLVYLLLFILLKFITVIANQLYANFIGELIENYLLTFSSFLALTFSLMLVPINIIIITRLYYYINQIKREDEFDSLQLQQSVTLTKIEKNVVTFFKKRKGILLLFSIAYVTGLFVINYTVNDSIVYLRWDVAVASHRGDTKAAPENSLSGIKSAINQGVDAVEIDVMMTKDGVLVLNHDQDLQRVAGVPYQVKDLTYEEITQIDIGHLFGEGASEHIPTLEEVFSELENEDTILIIDVKTVDSHEYVAKKLVDLIEEYGMEEFSYIQSFDNKLLQEIRKINPTIRIGQILFLAAGNLAKLDVDFYTIRQNMLTERFVTNAKKLNREVWVWTVNIERNMKEVLKYDVDGIITDFPEKAKNILSVDVGS